MEQEQYKTKYTQEILNEMAELLRAIGHPIRLRIVELLENGQQLTVSQIQTVLGVEQAVASHHLIILKNKDLLFARRVGKAIYYGVKNESIVHLLYFSSQSIRQPLKSTVQKVMPLGGEDLQ